MTDIATTLKNVLAAIAAALGRALTSTEKEKIQTDLGLNTFITGYYIDPDQTPTNTISYTKLKQNGINAIALRTSNDGSTGLSIDELKKVKKTTDKAGLELWAWTWCNKPSNCFTKTKELATIPVGQLVDAETYSMTDLIPTLTQMAKDSNGQGLIITVKPDGWDGEQKTASLGAIAKKYKNVFISFMSYTGDYNKTNAELAALYQKWNKIYPGKFIASLETYLSDQNPTAKTVTRLQAEIDAVKPYVAGVMLFRYGDNVSKYMMDGTQKKTEPSKDCYSVPSYTYDQQDTDYTCGPTSSVMLLSEMGITATENEMAQHEQTGTGGTGPNELMAGVIAEGKEHGVTLKAEKNSFDYYGLDKLCEYIADPKVGVIFHIMTNGWPSYYSGTYGHYTFPIRYCKSSKVWTIADPYKGVITLSNNECQNGIRMISEANQVIVIKKV